MMTKQEQIKTKLLELEALIRDEPEESLIHPFSSEKKTFPDTFNNDALTLLIFYMEDSPWEKRINIVGTTQCVSIQTWFKMLKWLLTGKE